MIIGFAGPKGCGKGFVSNALLSNIKKEEYTKILGSSGKNLSDTNGQDWQVASFADPLRAFILDLFNMDSRHSNGYLKEVPINMIKPSWQHIEAACNHHFRNTDISTHIHSMLTHECGIIDDLSISYRELMQTIGTDIIRDRISEHFWVDMMYAKTGNIIIDDVRMKNEAELVRDKGVLVHIENPLSNFLKNHPTEVGVARLPDDLVFVNNPSDVDTPYNVRIQKLKLEILERLNGRV